MKLTALPLLVVLIAAGCQSEVQLETGDNLPPADPPGEEDDDRGGPPNWQDCAGGFLGQYYNLSASHPDVEPGPNEVAPGDPSEVDWWDEAAFQRYDPSLDYGDNWWPVDEGLEGDPAYFAVKWNGWIRAFSDTTLQIALGAGGDVWIDIDREIVHADPGVKPFQPRVINIGLDSGQAPLEIRYAHRAGTSGFRFRVISGDAILCYPNYSDDEE